MKNVLTVRAIAVFFALAVGATAALSQRIVPQEDGSPQSQPHTPTITVTTRIVVLDVVVTDRNGNPVQRILTKDDFEILEDNEPQRIRSFDTPAEHLMPAGDHPVVSSAADLRKIGQAPVTVLVLDELNTRFEDMAYAREMVVKYLHSQPAILQQPTLLLVATNTSFKQLHDWTQNRDELIRTVEKHNPQYPWLMMHGQKSGDSAVQRMAQVLAALQQIAEASTGTPGRKNLIWVGNGFPSSNPVGMPPDEADKIETAVRRVTSRLLAARVTMYSINPTLAASSTIDIESPDDLNTSLDENGGDPFGANIAFSNLALSTGGMAFTGRNDLNNLIGQSIARGASYYTLSYSPSNHNEAAAKFRNIRIRMKDPSLHAITRDGYYLETKSDLNPVLDTSMSPEQVRRNLQLDLSNALASSISYNGLDISATKREGGQWIIHVTGNGPGWREQPEDQPPIEEATVVAGWYDSRGKLIGHAVREETAERHEPSSADFTLPLVVPVGAVRLRFVVRDAYNGHMGTVDVTNF